MGYNRTTWQRDLALLLAGHAIVYVGLRAVFSPQDAHMTFSGAFLPGYAMSLYALWVNDAKVWCAGLSWGWLGPLLIALSGICPDGSECVYEWLFFSDNCITFPLAFVGQLAVSLPTGRS